MSRLVSTPAFALLLAMSCGRSGLYTEDLNGGEYDGTGDTVPSGQGGAGPRGGGAGTATLAGGAGGSGGSAPAGSGGVVTAKGGSAGKAGGATGVAGKPELLHCRDGVLDPGEECDAGEGPYAHPAIELRSGGILSELPPLLGTDSAAAFYDYRDKSSHTGNENVAGSKLYFYRPFGESVVYLFTHHGIDFEATGFVQPDGDVTFEVSGLPESSFIVVSDDEGEVVKDSATSVHAEWVFGQNTDGFVLGGLPLPGNWHIFLTPTFSQGIESFTALSGDGYRTGLGLARTVELIANDEPGGCRRDCTVPRCGDGRLDAGEICDDGNDAALDGCSACHPGDFGAPLR